MTAEDRYFDDFAIGDTFETPAVVVTEADIIAFARQFDPQGWHLDAAAAAESPFKGIVASGWHTAALVMRLTVESGILRATGILGAGVDELRWHRPVRPGDSIRVRGEVVSKSEPEPGRSAGLMRVRLTASNQRGETVLSEIPTLFVPRRTNNRAE